MDMPIEYDLTIEANDPFCLRPGEATRLLRGHPWLRFAVLGDSVAVGLGDPVEGYSPLSWVERIAAQLRESAPDLAYLNLGVRDARARHVRANQLDAALAFAPDLALVAAGGNDALMPFYRADDVDREMRTVIAALRECGADVITVGMFDVSYAPAVPNRMKAAVSARMTELAARTAALAAELGAIHVHVTGHPAQFDPSAYSADGLHGNLRSHAICAAEAIRRLGAHLDHSARLDHSAHPDHSERLDASHHGLM
jgi:lysophospholipase L1-like esterase